MSRALSVVIVNRSSFRTPSAFLKKWVALINKLAAKKIKPSAYRGKELVIALVDDNEIKKLNKTYRGKNKPTDVLSFEGFEPDALGELVIAPAVIKRQAAEHGLSVNEELGYMVLHGFLHLLGYEHETNERDAKKMFALQDALFEQMLKKL